MRNFFQFKSGYILFAALIIITLAQLMFGQRGYPAGDCQTATVSVENENINVDLNDSMPHYQYKRISDSLENTREKELPHNTENGWEVLGIFIGDYGNGDSLFYAGSKNYFLTNPDAEYYRKGNKNIHKYVVWNNTKNGWCSGIQKTENTPVKFIMDNEHKSSGYGMFLIPLSRLKGKVLNFLIISIVFLLVVASLYIFFGLFGRILIAITKGEAFSSTNVTRLFLAGRYILMLGLLPFVVQGSFYFLTKRNLPTDIDFSFFRAFFEGYNFIVAGLITLMIANAFKRGYELQEEQELTV
jgi:hypothetical protein